MKEGNKRRPSVILKNFFIEGGGSSVRVQSNVVKNKKLDTSSHQWMKRHINDEFTQKSKALGYRARSAFKLIEIQEKFGIIGKSSAVLDLGCAPGSWSEVIVKLTNKRVVGIDLLETEQMVGAVFLQGDFLDEDIQKQAIELNGGNKFDVIVSDISPNTTGLKTVDHLRIIYVLEIEVQFVVKNLREGGSFAAKVFQGEGLEVEIQKLKRLFADVKIFKPKASRKESKEVYLVCLHFLGLHE